jgi:hypothetical protein
VFAVVLVVFGVARYLNLVHRDALSEYPVKVLPQDTATWIVTLS